MLYGVNDAVMVRLQAVFSHYPQVRRVVLFGSRARGDYRVHSDLDLAVFSDNGISGALYADIDEAAGIYKVDIVDMAALKHDKMRANIDKEGIEIYLRQHLPQDQSCAFSDR
ncbi:MAG: nucleotidyltransferase domain-containing protein [Anaerohalosphaeraceae bacterium]